MSPIKDKEKTKLVEYGDKREDLFIRLCFRSAKHKIRRDDINVTWIHSVVECVLYMAKSKPNIKESEIINQTTDDPLRSNKLFGNDFMCKSNFNSQSLGKKSFVYHLFQK